MNPTAIRNFMIYLLSFCSLGRLLAAPLGVHQRFAEKEADTNSQAFRGGIHLYYAALLIFCCSSAMAGSICTNGTATGCLSNQAHFSWHYDGGACASEVFVYYSWGGYSSCDGGSCGGTVNCDWCVNVPPEGGSIAVAVSRKLCGGGPCYAGDWEPVYASPDLPIRQGSWIQGYHASADENPPEIYNCNEIPTGTNDPCQGGVATTAGTGTGAQESEDENQNVTKLDPVNLGSGGTFFEDPDRQPVPLPGQTLSAALAFGRFQSSGNPSIAPLGGGWTHTYNLRLIEQGDSAIVTDWQGSRRAYTLTNGAYAGDGTATLTKTNDMFVWQLTHGTRYVFNIAQGYLVTNITDRIGNTVELTYNASALLTQAVDSAGRQLTLLYDGSNRLTSVMDPIPRTNSYTYDAMGRLNGVSDALGTKAQYFYGDATSSNAITQLINARGYTNGFAYNSLGQPITETNTLGRVQTYTWVNTNQQVTVTQFDSTSYTIYNDTTGAVTARVDAAGTQQYWRDALHRPTNVVDRLGFPTQYTYSSNSCGCGISGDLLRLVDALGRTNSWTYEPTFNFPLTYTNAAGGVTLWTYDGKGDVTTNTDAAVQTTIYGYDGAGNRTSLFDANSHTTTFGYDAYGNRTNVTDALTHATSFTYDLVGRLTGRTDALTRSESFTWDDRDRLTRYVDGAGETNQLGYDGNGNRTSWTNALSNVRTYGYDALDRLASITLPDSGSPFLTFGYDDANNRTNITDALGHSTTFGYDALSRLTAVTNALTKVWQFTVDAEGRRILAIDPNTHSQGFVYDAVGQLTAWTNALTQVTTFGYDKLGNLTSVIDPRTNPLTFGYDAVSRLTNVSYAGGSAEQFIYDGVGSVTGTVTRAGQTIALTYDAANRLTQKSYAGAGDIIGFGYDNANQLTAVGWTNSGVNISTLFFAYDSAGRLTNETQVVGPASPRAVCYEYYADGRRKKLIYPDSTFITYDYNTKGWLTDIKDGGTNSIVTYAYDDAGRRIQRTLENNTFTLYDYDNANQLTSVWHQVVGGVTNTISHYQYGYDDAGNRKWVTRAQQSNKGDVYTYDAADQLIDVKYDATNPDGSASGWDREVTYGYDAAGNRTNLIEKIGNATNTVSYTANSDNQLTSESTVRQGLTVTGFVEPGANSNKWSSSTAASHGLSASVSSTNGTFAIPGVPVSSGANALTVTVTDVSGNIGTQVVNVTIASGATTLGYDANGNQTNDAVWSYTYDRENRLVSATSTATTINYSYDALGRLIERRTSGASVTTNRMYYAGWQLVAEYNGTGSLQRKYVYGPGIDEPVRISSGGMNYYYHADALGSITEISDTQGLRTESYTYDIYGAQTIYNSSGTVTNSSAIGNRLSFTSRYIDADTGSYSYRMRYYNPTLGRFVQTDPLGIDSGDFNLYRYVLNNPVRWTDSLGLGAVITLNNGTSFTSPTGNDFIKQLQATADHTINSIDIYGHAYGNQSFNPGEGNANGGITVNNTSKYPGIYVFSVTDNGDLSGSVVNITKLLKSKLAAKARIGFRGCYTADTARNASHYLPDVTVTGATGPTEYYPPEN